MNEHLKKILDALGIVVVFDSQPVISKADVVAELPTGLTKELADEACKACERLEMARLREELYKWNPPKHSRPS